MQTMNGKPRHTYKCQNIYGRVYAETFSEGFHLVFVEPCGLEFKTCGNPQKCPKCHVELEIE